MKQLILISLLLIGNLTFAQKSENELKLDEVNKVAEENPDKAIKMLEEILKSEPDTTPVYARAFFNVAVIYSMKGDVENTKVWYEKVIQSNFNPKDEGPSFFEPYACYQHNAAMQLGIFLYYQKQYEEALKNLQKAENDYPYLNKSGTSLAKRTNAIDIWETRCYMGLGKTDEAIVTLITSSEMCFSPMKGDLEATAKQLIEQAYGLKKFQKLLNKGIEKAELTEINGQKNWKIPFNDTEIIICIQDEESSKEKLKQHIEQSYWYKN